MTPPKQNVLVICGPTASGKTSFALRVASLLPVANILSVDSRQTYKGFDIVTGRDIPQNLPQNIHFFGFDIFAAGETSNLADFQKYSQRVIKESLETNTPLIIVGGTGLYLKAITQNLDDVTIPQNAMLRSGLECLTVGELQIRLRDLNPEKLNSLNNSDANNPRRLIRAIEISTFKKGLKVSGAKLSNLKPSPKYLWVGFMPTKEDIVSAIHKRVLSRIKGGAITEVQNMLTKYPNKSLPIYTSLGVPQIIKFLDSQISHDDLVREWEKAETDYARRQIVWFKKQTDIIWYDKSISLDQLALKCSEQISYNHDQEKTR